VNRCSTCRNWVADDLNDDDLAAGFRICTKAHDWHKNGYEAASFVPGDPFGCQSFLMTKADFGCTEYEEIV
jgi:hypothetical protein